MAQLTFDAAALAAALDQARLEQGRLLGLLGAIGLEQANAVQRELLGAGGAGHRRH
ncbi:MAG: hypothetical protein IPN06_05150 [Burkholderiales bacterium]|nr:hypothetical protein [Burkholderiales bacterium]